MESDMEKNDEKLIETSKAPRTFEEILDKIRSFGPYQIRTFVLVSLFDVPCAIILQFFIFAGANPGWTCVRPQDSGNDTHNLGGTIFRNTTKYTTRSDFSYVNSSLPDVTDVCDVNGHACAEYEFKEYFTSTVTEWKLLCDQQYIPTFITTLTMAGVFIGACVFGQLADTYGRRRPFFIGSLLMMVSNFCTGFAPSWQVFAVLRFFAGLFTGGVLVMGFVIPMEIIGMQWRTICGCMGAWQLGTISFALSAYLLPDWRHLAMVTGVLGLPLMISYIVVQESPRWLIQKGRFEEARRIIRTMAHFNKRPEPELDCLPAILAQSLNENRERKNVSYLDLFRSRDLARRTVAMMYLWFVCSLGFYALAVNVRDLSGNRYVNVTLMALIEWVFNLSVIGTAKWFGRRPAVLGYLTIGTLSLFSIMVIDLTAGSSSYINLRAGLALLGKANVAAAWNVAYLLTAEVFPTVVRNIGAASSSMAGRIGGVVAPQVAYLHFIHETVPYIVVCTLTLSSAAMCFWLLPETRGQPLPDSLPTKEGFWCCMKKNTTRKETEEGEEFREIQNKEVDTAIV